VGPWDFFKKKLPPALILTMWCMGIRLDPGIDWILGLDPTTIYVMNGAE
jgi:hypothetical protein